MKRLSRFAFVAAFVASTVLAQVDDPLGSRFARATITANDRPLLMGTIFEDTADNLIVKGAPLANVIARAYGLENYQVVDAPEWVYAAHVYDIEAVPPPAELIASDEALMLQSLLDDRFQLQHRRETREVEMLVLDIADPERQRELQRQTPVYRGAPPAALEPGKPIANAVRPMIARLEREHGEPILDLTETNFIYALPSYLPVQPPPTAEQIRRLGSWMEDSGLVVERRVVPLDVLVVTHVEHPTLDLVDR